MTGLSFAAATLMLTGIWFNSYPRIRGQYLMLAADSLWAAYAFYNEQWALLAQSTILFMIALRAIHSWSKQGIKL